MTSMDREIARIEQRLVRSCSRSASYTPPVVTDLIKRIDIALSERRAA
ncbi:hypothetical protein [Sphingomonas sp.]